MPLLRRSSRNERSTVVLVPRTRGRGHGGRPVPAVAPARSLSHPRCRRALEGNGGGSQREVGGRGPGVGRRRLKTRTGVTCAQYMRVSHAGSDVVSVTGTARACVRSSPFATLPPDE